MKIHIGYIILFIGILFIAFIPDKPKQQVVVMCYTAEQVVTISNNYLRAGYIVKQVVSQAVATSVNSRANSADVYDSPYRDLYGKFVLILEK